MDIIISFMNGKEIKQMIADINEEALFVDGLDGDEDAFNDALIGYGEKFGVYDVAVYDMNAVLKILEEKYNMTDEEAIEWYNYNILGSYIGDNMPIFVNNLRE